MGKRGGAAATGGEAPPSSALVILSGTSDFWQVSKADTSLPFELARGVSPLLNGERKEEVTGKKKKAKNKTKPNKGLVDANNYETSNVGSSCTENV